MTSPPLPKEDLNHILEHTRGLWDEARGRSFFITGGTGFFGKWLLESFAHINNALSLNMHAHILTRDPLKIKKEIPHLASYDHMSWVVGDVRDFMIPQGKFDYVVHGATPAIEPIDALKTLETIINGTRRVLELASTCGTKKLLFISSGAVYGKQPGTISPFPEDHSFGPNSIDPCSAYGEGKRVGELMTILWGLKESAHVKVARCFTFVGPHLPLKGHFAIGNFIADALRGEPILVKSEGKAERSYLYAADLAIWLWTLLFSGSPGQAYNVGSPNGLSISEVAQAVATASGNMVPVIVSATPGSGKLFHHYLPDVKKAEVELGLKSWIPLDEAIRKTMSWQRRSPTALSA